MIIILIICFIFPSIVIAGDIVVGKTYSVVEKDSLKELEEKAESVNWKDVTKSASNKLKGYRPADYNPLPHTEKTKKYRTSVIHTVEFDVTDQNGELIYPRGYQFNPLDYVTLPYELIFIDGNEQSHIDWANKYIEDHTFVQVYVVDGPVFDVINKMDRKVYYAGHRITDKLNIHAVPSVVYQEGKQLSIEQIFVTEKELKDDKK